MKYVLVFWTDAHVGVITRLAGRVTDREGSNHSVSLQIYRRSENILYGKLQLHKSTAVALFIGIINKRGFLSANLNQRRTAGGPRKASQRR